MIEREPLNTELYMNFKNNVLGPIVHSTVQSFHKNQSTGCYRQLSSFGSKANFLSDITTW